MQNENDHIEDLFRRAAESYPLKTSGSDWSQVASKLNFEKDKRDRPLVFFFKKNKILLSVLLLLLITASSYFIFSLNSHPTLSSTKNEELPNSRSVNTSHLSHNSIVGGLSKTIQKASIAATPINIIKSPSGNSNPVNVFVSHVKKIRNTKSAITSFINNPRPESDNSFTKDEQDEKLLYNIGPTIVEPHIPSLMNLLKLNDQTNLDGKSMEPDRGKNIDHHRVDKNWSLSLLAGIDKSNIKQQKYSNTGATIGATIGYSINHWLIETGFIFDKKYYYSDGKYFNPKVAINPYWNITSLNGNCAMFEIPLNIGYSLKINSKNKVVFKTGLSSYLMNHETYDYNYTSYGMVYSGNVGYKSSIKNWFAVTNFAMNYSFRLRNHMGIGIEPYFKVPVSNIGTGRMPIASYGVNLLLSKKF